MALCAALVAACAPTPMTVEQAALDEQISRHFEGQHFGRFFFVDRHTKIDAGSAHIATGTKTVTGKKGEAVSMRWATLSDADGDLLAFMIGSDAFDHDWLVPEISEEEFKEEWAKCKGERSCQDRLIDRALDDCERAKGTDDCEKECWWFNQYDFIICL